MEARAVEIWGSDIRFILYLLIGEWQHNFDGRSAARFRGQAKGAVEEGDALAHPAYAQPGRLPGGLVALAVVVNAQGDRLVVLKQLERDVGGLRVAGDVGQALLGDAEEGRFVKRRIRSLRASLGLGLQMKIHTEVQALPAILGQPAQGGLESQVVQHGRPQLQGKRANALQRALRQAGQLVQARTQLLARRRAQGRGGQGLQRLLQDLCVDQQGGQVLAALVVQFQGDAPALLFLSLQDQHGLRAAGRLQAIEHPVKRLGQLAYLCAARYSRRAQVRSARADRANRLQQTEQRAEAGPQEQDVERERYDGRAHNKRCIDQVMMALQTMARHPQPDQRLADQHQRIGQDDLLKERESPGCSPGPGLCVRHGCRSLLSNAGCFCSTGCIFLRYLDYSCSPLFESSRTIHRVPSLLGDSHRLPVDGRTTTSHLFCKFFKYF